MKTLKQLLGVAALAALMATAQGQSLTNNNPAINIVPYGGAFTYSLTWSLPVTNGVSWHVDWVTTNDVVWLNLSDASFPKNYTYSYTINGVDARNEGYYCTWFWEYWSGRTIHSDTVYLHVSPAVLTQPRDTTCLSGSSTSMGIAAGPSTASFQWIDAATGSTLWTGPSFSPTTASSGKRIYCKISNAYGSVSSTPVLLTVGSPPTITAQPSNVITNYGSTVTFNATATGSQPMFYQWYKNGISIQGANLNYLLLSSVSNSDAGAYQLTITNAFGAINSQKCTLSVGGIEPPPPPAAGIGFYSNNPVVFFPAIPGANYTVQMTTNLSAPVWVDVTNGIPFNGVQITNAFDKAFFRLN
jgi:hypothetical protein